MEDTNKKIKRYLLESDDIVLKQYNIIIIGLEGLIDYLRKIYGNTGDIKKILSLFTKITNNTQDAYNEYLEFKQHREYYE